MMKAIEVLFEDKVFKPIRPVEGIDEHETAWAVIHTKPRKSALLRLFGTMNRSEAENMRATIDREFERIEGQW